MKTHSVLGLRGGAGLVAVALLGLACGQPDSDSSGHNTQALSVSAADGCEGTQPVDAELPAKTLNEVAFELPATEATEEVKAGPATPADSTCDAGSSVRPISIKQERFADLTVEEVKCRVAAVRNWSNSPWTKEENAELDFYEGTVLWKPKRAEMNARRKKEGKVDEVVECVCMPDRKGSSAIGRFDRRSIRTDIQCVDNVLLSYSAEFNDDLPAVPQRVFVPIRPDTAQPGEGESWDDRCRVELFIQANIEENAWADRFERYDSANRRLTKPRMSFSSLGWQASTGTCCVDDERWKLLRESE